MQDAPDHKQRTLEPPALSWRTMAAYVPLHAEGSESVPAVVCAFCATSLAESEVSQILMKKKERECAYVSCKTADGLELMEHLWEQYQRAADHGNVGMSGCSDAQYQQHFALWAFMGSPLIIGSDLRSLDDTNRETLLCKGLIAINQDEECRPAFVVGHNGEMTYVLAKLLSGGRIALGFFNLDSDNDWNNNISLAFDDLGIHSESGTALKLTDAITGEELGTYRDGYRCNVPVDGCKVLIGEPVRR